MAANAVCCDRCGKFQKMADLRNGGYPVPKEKSWRSIHIPNFDMDKDDELLLCPGCAQEFDGFMNRKQSQIAKE
jgi:hypothetical protein